MIENRTNSVRHGDELEPIKQSALDEVLRPAEARPNYGGVLSWLAKKFGGVA